MEPRDIARLATFRCAAFDGADFLMTRIPAWPEMPQYVIMQFAFVPNLALPPSLRGRVYASALASCFEHASGVPSDFELAGITVEARVLYSTVFEKQVAVLTVERPSLLEVFSFGDQRWLDPSEVEAVIAYVTAES